MSLAVASLVLTGAPAVSANPSSVPPWEEGYARDETLLRRLAFVMKGLRTTASSDPKLKNVLDRIRVRTPTTSMADTFPTVYAIPAADKKFVVIESRFANQIGALAAAGAHLSPAARPSDR
jgi:hypothetical protein